MCKGTYPLPKTHFRSDTLYCCYFPKLQCIERLTACQTSHCSVLHSSHCEFFSLEYWHDPIFRKPRLSFTTFVIQTYSSSRTSSCAYRSGKVPITTCLTMTNLPVVWPVRPDVIIGCDYRYDANASRSEQFAGWNRREFDESLYVGPC